MDIYQLYSFISDLSNADPRVRYKAVSRLGVIKDLRSVDPLLKCLNDSDRWCRIMVIRALGDIGHPSARKPLELLLASDDSLIISTAIIALKSAGDEKTIDLVAGFLLNSHPRLCADAVEAIGDLSWRFRNRTHLSSIKPLLHSRNNRVVANAVVSLCQNQESSPEEMVSFIREKLLSSPEKWTRASGVFALGAIGFGEEVLIRTLNDQSIDVVMNVIRSLGKIKHPACVHALVELLARDNIRHKVVIALGDLGDKTATQALTKYFSISNIAVQRKLLDSLGRIADPQAIDLLCEKLADPHLVKEAILALGRMRHPKASQTLVTLLKNNLPPEIELAVIDALGNTKDPAIIPTLMDLFKSPQPPRIFETVSWALAKFGKEGFSFLFTLLNDPKATQYALDAFSEMKEEAVPLLIEHLKDAAACENAMKAIVQTGEVALPFLRQKFQKEAANPHLQLVICKCVYRILSPNSLEFFIENLGADNAEIRRFSALVVPMFMNDDSFLPHLHKHLSGPDPLVRMACVRALGRHRKDPEIQNLLAQCLDDSYWGVRYYALEAVSDIETPELLGKFKTLIQSTDQIVSRKAVQQYMKACGIEIRDLIVGTNYDPQLLREIFPILKNISTKDEVEEIIPLLGSPVPEIVNFACEVLEKVLDLAKPVLLARLQDSDPLIRNRIARLLGQTGIFEALPVIAAMLVKENRPDQRRELVQSLSFFGSKAVPIFFSLLESHEHKEDLRLQELLISSLEALNQGKPLPLEEI